MTGKRDEELLAGNPRRADDRDSALPHDERSISVARDGSQPRDATSVERSFLAARLEAVLPEPARQRPPADAEDARRAALVAARLLQHALDVPDLDVAERGQLSAPRIRPQRVGEILDADPLVAGVERRRLDDLAQLADVVRPAVRAAGRFRLGREIARGARELRAALLEEGACERDDVVRTLAERRQVEALVRETCVEVVAEQAGGDARPEVDARAREAARVDLRDAG